MGKRKVGKASGRRNKRKSPTLRRHKGSMMLIIFVLVLLTVVLGVNSVKLRSRNANYKLQEAELKAQIQEQEDRAKEIEEFEEYVKTDEYIKEVAEEKLGLVDPDEILFKPSN